jgi:hypothetical protein
LQVAMIWENGWIKYNFLKQFNQFIWQIGGHECNKTGRQSSSDLYLFSLPWSRRIPKYWSNGGEVLPGGGWTCWNFWIV